MLGLPSLNFATGEKSQTWNLTQISRPGGSRRHKIWRQISRLGGKSWNFPWNFTSIFRSCVSLLGHHMYAHLQRKIVAVLERVFTWICAVQALARTSVHYVCWPRGSPMKLCDFLHKISWNELECTRVHERRHFVNKNDQAVRSLTSSDILNVSIDLRRPHSNYHHYYIIEPSWHFSVNLDASH